MHIFSDHLVLLTDFYSLDELGQLAAGMMREVTPPGRKSPQMPPSRRSVKKSKYVIGIGWPTSWDLWQRISGISEQKTEAIKDNRYTDN